MNGEYLSEIVSEDDIKEGALNLIYAPCGSGKTTYALNGLSLYGFANYGNLPLYLIDTVNGKEQLLRSGKSVIDPWTEQEYWYIPGIMNVMTYAGYAFMAQNAPDRDPAADRLVICDELHNAIKWSKWEDDELHEKALGLISYHIAIDLGTFVALSATPDRIRTEFSWCLNEIPLCGEPRHYEEAQVTKYRNLNLVLNQIQQGQRGIIYLPHISEIQKYEKLMQDHGFKTSSIWSIRNGQHPMSKAQLDDRKLILDHKHMPAGADILFINSSCETSISIGDTADAENDRLDFMIIHSNDPDVQVQVRGRYRNDLPHLYLHDSSVDDEIIIPSHWLDRNLRKSDVEQIIRELNIRNGKRELVKVPTFCKLALDSGYAYGTKTINGIRYKVFSE